ncbi:MAG: sigma-54 dependent transcriptional regulator [Pirellulales bacterium]
MNRSTKTDNPYRVLVVDDHARARESVADVLRCAGYEVAMCASAIEALARLAERPVDVVVTDLQMPGMDGLEFIREIERRRLGVQVLMITAHASVASAVDAMRHGAFDYLEKPFDALALERSVSQACERRRLVSQPTSVESRSAAAHLAPRMIGNSPAIEELRRRTAQVAATDETVLICGESGTGKELVAQTVHALSRRVAGPLVSLNCPVLSTQLTESELFGHKRGAFTGAEADRTGRFELAHGGSILLDEVTEIDLTLQAKLLRVLQERSFERVGSSDTVSVDVRVLATTNRDLPTEIAAGRFREDLYFRLAVVPLTVPPLRERGEDVLELADHFLEHASQRLGRGPFELTATARELLIAYEWPGNVRELQNIITRACVLNAGEPIGADELRPWLAADRIHARQHAHESVREPQPAAAGTTLDEAERRLIETTLAQYHGHRAKTAEALGIGLRTLSGKLRQYGYAPREKNFARAG